MAEKKGAGGEPQKYDPETGKYGDGKEKRQSADKREKTVEAIRKYSSDPERDIAEYEKAHDDIKPDAIQLPDETLPRSVGAKWANYPVRMPNGTDAYFVEGTKLRNKQVFAGKRTKTPFRDAEVFAKKYGGKAEDWQKVKCEGTLEQNGKSFDGEIHWCENPVIGAREEFKFKRYL